MSRNWKYCSIAILVLAFVFFLNSNKVPEDALQDNKVAQTAMVVSIKSEKTASTLENKTGEKYEVVKVVDGDTMDVLINGKVERLRLIGINTPETVDPRKTVECFGLDASNRAKEILTGKKVFLEADQSQDERDKYGRLLRYVFLEDGTNFNLEMIRDGFAYEYTYNLPYKYQAEFKLAQKNAQAEKAGLWGELCNGERVILQSKNSAVQTTNENGECNIKGNISSTGEKIYHTQNCPYYSKTIISESQGEKWFCSESEAVTAGWRKAQNCN